MSVHRQLFAELNHRAKKNALLNELSNVDTIWI